MNEKIIRQFVIYTGALMIIFPILINMLMFISISPVAGNENTWIGSLSTFWGAIVGGIISGVLTLLGVSLTIKENKEKDFRESLPERIMFAEDLITIFERQYELLSKTKKTQEPTGLNLHYRERINYIIEYLEVDGLLVKSSKVNLATYRATRNLYDYLKKISYEKKTTNLTYSDIEEKIEKCLKDVKAERDNFIKKIDL